jgi:hypothetical protein
VYQRPEVLTWPVRSSIRIGDAGADYANLVVSECGVGAWKFYTGIWQVTQLFVAEGSSGCYVGVACCALES